jgi:hypothetical protein
VFTNDKSEQFGKVWKKYGTLIAIRVLYFFKRGTSSTSVHKVGKYCSDKVIFKFYFRIQKKSEQFLITNKGMSVLPRNLDVLRL